MDQDGSPTTPHAEEGTTSSMISPLRMSPNVQAEGLELQEVLQLFKQSTAQPISGAILPTPPHKVQSIGPEVSAQKRQEPHQAEQRRQSPRLKQKMSKKTPVIQMA